jgi:hypothetical protein
LPVVIGHECYTDARPTAETRREIGILNRQAAIFAEYLGSDVVRQILDLEIAVVVPPRRAWAARWLFFLDMPGTSDDVLILDTAIW